MCFTSSGDGQIIAPACDHLCEGVDWSRGTGMKAFCELTGEVNPNCDDCEEAP